MTIAITGATGLLGRILTNQILQERPDKLHILTRDVTRAKKIFAAQLKIFEPRFSFFSWMPDTAFPPMQAFHQVQSVVNLLGEGVANARWSPQQKAKIYTSRIKGTRNLVTAINQLEQKPEILVSTSAVGFYRLSHHPHDPIDEAGEPGTGFLAQTCRDWETEAMQAQCRCCIIRAGVILGHTGGMLAKILPLFRMGLGGILGNGQQYLSWIHVEDLARIYLAAIDGQSWQGIYNGTAPTPVTNSQFTHELGNILHRPTLLPVPGRLLTAIFGEMMSLALQSQIVLPKRLQEENFSFHFPTISSALCNLLIRPSGRNS